MTLTNSNAADEFGPLPGGIIHSHLNAVSWGAILAGAAAAAALSLSLLILGTGLGLSSVSPWAFNGVTATTFGVTTILWLTFTQLIASGVGGYIAGRLRTKWVDTQFDEVYFRDTVHGFLAWAVAVLATAALLTSVISSIVSGGIQAGATVAGGVAGTAAVAELDRVKPEHDNGPMAYFVDSLFRRDINVAIVKNGGVPEPIFSHGAPFEVTRIFLNAIHTGPLPPEDIRYVGQVVAARTGLTQQAAETRVTDTYNRVQTTLHNAEILAKETTDKARKATAYAALWLFISLLIGAFVASLSATFGGRQRDL
ncbi:MAG: hypothetical protein PHC94_07630 [Methylobacter sp.]|nr:hypothetical protein [Methylobacter sp.]